MFRKSAILLGLLSIITVELGCATSPLGRKQLILVSEPQMSQLGEQAFEQLKKKEKTDSDVQVNQYVKCIVDPLTAQAKGQTDVKSWDVAVFQSDQANAFALPGGNIGVYSGLLKVAKTDAQLAAVIGHEIGHVIAQHSAERMSQQLGTELGLQALGSLTQGNPNRKILMGVLGVGAQVGILLPFSRTQESEADLIGLDLMARAGFDPRESVELWKNMMASGGHAPPEWLSTHPASENRIQALQKQMNGALRKQERAKEMGMSPSCRSLQTHINGHPS